MMAATAKSLFEFKTKYQFSVFDGHVSTIRRKGSKKGFLSSYCLPISFPYYGKKFNLKKLKIR